MADFINEIQYINGTDGGVDISTLTPAELEGKVGPGKQYGTRGQVRYDQLVTKYNKDTVLQHSSDIADVVKDMYGSNKTVGDTGTVLNTVKLMKDDVTDKQTDVTEKYTKIAGTDPLANDGNGDGWYQDIVKADDMLTKNEDSITRLYNDFEGKDANGDNYADMTSRVDTLGRNLNKGVNSEVMSVGSDLLSADSYIFAVENNRQNITAVAEDILDTNKNTINTVAANIDDVKVVADMQTNASALTDNMVDINIIGNDLRDRDADGELYGENEHSRVLSVGINLQKGETSEVLATGSHIAEVIAVGKNLEGAFQYATDAGSITEEVEVSTDPDTSTIGIVAAEINNVAAVGADLRLNEPNIPVVAAHIEDIQTVGTITADVTSVSKISDKVVTVSDNIVDIQNAEENAQLAIDYATKDVDDEIADGKYSALHYATKAGDSAADAETARESAAWNNEQSELWANEEEDTEVEDGKYSALHHAAKASASAEAAKVSEDNAKTSEDVVVDLYDKFHDVFLGTKTEDPTEDNDGDDLAAGMLYYNSDDSQLKIYDGSDWSAAAVDTDGALTAADNLSDLDDASKARTNLGVEIGTDVQAYDENIVSDENYVHIDTLDEDDMASDDDVKVPTQQSVKAYVDSTAARIEKVTDTATNNRYDKQLLNRDTVEVTYTSDDDIDTIRYTDDGDTDAPYYRDVYEYDDDGNLTKIKHYFNTDNLDTESASTTLEYVDGKYNKETYTE